MVLMLIGCKEEDPLKYKGCVIIDKDTPCGYHFKLKLTDSLRDKEKSDYRIIYVPKYEYNLFNIGDTIK